MSFKRFFRLSATRSALSTLLLIIPILLGYWEQLALPYKAFMIAVLGIINFYLVYNEYKKPRLKIENFLELMVKSLWGPESASHFRSNIMVYNSKSENLQIKYNYNMMGAVDREFEIGKDQGCAGRAFSNKQPFWVDILASSHGKYFVESGKVWSDMRSVMSVPIIKEKAVIGVLNVDSDLDLSTSKFDQGDVFIIVNAYSDLIAEVLDLR